MFPMITTLEEMRRVRGTVRRACSQLRADGKEFGQVPIGMMLEVPAAERLRVAGFQVREPGAGESVAGEATDPTDPMVCRCERVSESEIVSAIRAGVRDMNQLKAVVRSGMGGCGGKTCTELILRLFRREGVDLQEVTLPTSRPLLAEVHLGDFAQAAPEDGS